MDETLDFFTENGYAVVSGALTAAEVAAINDGIAADCAAHPEYWEPGPRPGQGRGGGGGGGWGVPN